MRRAAEGCPKFGDASVVDRPFFAHEEPSVQPGLHSPQQGTHEVVWWDPRTLKLAPPANLGLRQEEILKGDPNEEESPSLIAYREWKAQREKVNVGWAGERVRCFHRDRSGGSAQRFFRCREIRSSAKSALADRRAARFGTLVHTILRDVALDGKGIDELAKVHGRILGATDQEIEHAAEAATAALKHPLLERARKSKLCRRELPILLKLEGNRILEGVIDLAFEENGCWHIVDFKTDAEIGPSRKSIRKSTSLVLFGDGALEQDAGGSSSAKRLAKEHSIRRWNRPTNRCGHPCDRAEPGADCSWEFPPDR